MFEEQKEIIIKYYEYFYSKLTQNPNYLFKIKKNEEISLNNFLKYLQLNKIFVLSLGEEFWFNYFSFQFEYWRTKKTFLGKNKVLFFWIIGENAWNKFENRVDNYLYFCEKGFNKFYNIKKEDLILKKIKEKNFDFGEEIKKIFNEDEKLGGCFLYSSLYNEKNKECQNCKEKENCIKIKNICVK